MRDLNNDQLADIVSANSNDGNLRVFLGRGDGTFAPANTFAVGAGDLAIAVEHFSITKDSLAILLGNGDGTFQPVKFTLVPGSDESVAIGDFNHDGKPDVAVAGNTIGIYLGLGDGAFQAPLTIADSGILAVGDFNRDDVPDLVVSGLETAVLLGNGDGTFQMPQTIFSEQAGSPRVADVNGDGKLDLALSVSSEGLWVLPGRGDGTFAPGRLFATGSQFTGSCNLVDLNGDGLPEAVVSNVSNALTVLINTTRPHRP